MAQLGWRHHRRTNREARANILQPSSQHVNQLRLPRHRNAERRLTIDLSVAPLVGHATVTPADARTAEWDSDIWITDPGYADAINYEELSEFFLAWYEKRLPKLFPGWHTDSRRALAVRGKGESFRQAMVECYRRLASLMPDNGFQIVMFTHQDAEVWSDVALILWAAGLQVTAAWTIATETESSGIKQGNYVQGTVLLVLRKRKGDERGDLSDIFPEIQREVREQLASMQALDDKEEPNFGGADYQLAAYAAVLRVLTGYATVAEINVERELYRTRGRGERSPLAELIEKAVKIASDALVPDGLDESVWRKLGPEERLYLKGVEVEAHGEYREGVYQKFARGYGVREYRSLLASGEANATRLKTPSELRNRDLEPGSRGLGGTLLRRVLYAVYETGAEDEPVEEAAPRSALYPLQDDERKALLRFLELLESGEDDPKAREVERILLEGVDGSGPWLDQGCIVFSQYYDSALWLAHELSRRRPREPVALYAGAARSGIVQADSFTRHDRADLKARVQRGEIRLILGTDAASEGLNLQRLGTLINLDLPWNPTRLEQRKGRIQRIGQVRDEVFLYNMRYRGSVEDRVHQLLSTRLQAIHDLFGQLPDTLEDVWIAVALHDERRAREVIDQVPESHPFEVRYDRVEPIDWESCARVLDHTSQIEVLSRGW